MKPERGFSLVELSIVLFIGAVLLTAGLRALNTQMDNSAYSSTKTRQEIIKDALSAYLGKNGRLPCPDTKAAPDGNESYTNSNGILVCENLKDTTSVIKLMGVVPYTTLGLPKEIALDGWENYINYGVSQRWTLTYNSAAAPPSTAPAANTRQTSVGNTAFNIDAPGGLTVNDRITATGVISPITNVAVAVLISYGKNGLGATTINGSQYSTAGIGDDEGKNVDGSGSGATFFKREYTENAATTGGAFDDVVRIIQRTELISPLTKDGSLTSSAGSLNQTMSAITDAIVGATFSTYVGGTTKAYYLPPTIPTFVPTLDPWGNQIQYLPTCWYLQTTPPSCTGLIGTAGIQTSTVEGLQGITTVPALVLVSSGPDGISQSTVTQNLVSRGGDDIVINVPLAQIKGLLAKTGWP